MLQDIKIYRLGKSWFKFQHVGGGIKNGQKNSDVFYGRPLTLFQLQEEGQIVPTTLLPAPHPDFQTFYRLCNGLNSLSERTFREMERAS